MGYIVRMPKLGMEMQEGELLEWKVAVGDRVAEGDVVAEIESEKSVADVEAREDGVFRERLLEPGDAVAPGAPMGIVAGPNEDVTDLRAEAGVAEPTEAATTADPADTSAADPAATAQGEQVRASPRARQLADERGVDLSELSGSGPGGAVVADDVEPAATGADVERSAAGATVTESATEAPAGTEPATGDTAATGSETSGTAPASAAKTERTVRERNEFGEMRRTIAERLGESYRNAVHVTVDRETDVEALLHASEVADDALDADVSMPDLLLVALSEALSAHPAFNATYEDGVHTVYEDQHVGIAVDVDAGLVTPVLRGLDGLSLPEIARERRRLTDLALDGEYATDDLARGTFTVSNLGVLGVDSFTPVINPPEVAILGINRVREEPRPARDGDGVEFRRRLTVSLSFDHRVVDGADAARVLDTFASAVESPWSALLERT